MIRRDYDEQTKDAINKRCLEGESVSVVAAEMNVPRSTLYLWVKDAKAAAAEQEQKHLDSKALDQREYFKLKERVIKLEGMLEVLKTASSVIDMPLADKLKILDELYQNETYSVRLMCEALEVPRGTFYNYIKRGKKGNTVAARRREEMRQKITAIFYDTNQVFGAPKITAILKAQGEVVSRGFVSELMKEMGLVSIRSGSKKQFADESRKCRNFVKGNSKQMTQTKSGSVM